MGAQGPQFYADKTAKRSCQGAPAPFGSTSNGKRESATWGDMALSGLRAQRGAVEGPHFRRGRGNCSLDCETPGASLSSAIPDGAALYVIIGCVTQNAGALEHPAPRHS